MEHNMENIKVGDIVIFTIGDWNQKTIIDKVTKVTPKQFEAKGHRFWKKDGTMVGSYFNHCRIAPKRILRTSKRKSTATICALRFAISSLHIKTLNV